MEHVPHLAIFMSQHTPIVGHKPIHFAACGGHQVGNNIHPRQWLLRPCSGTHRADMLSESAYHPVDVPHHYTIRVAGRTLHATHRLGVYEHLSYCKDCGKVAGHRVVHLADPCDPEPTPTGVRNLRRIRQGLRPYGTPWWPNDIPIVLRGHCVTL